MKKILNVGLFISIAILISTCGELMYYNSDCETDQSISDAIFDRTNIFPDKILCKKEAGKDLFILFEKSNSLYLTHYKRSLVYKNRCHFDSFASGEKNKFNVQRITQYGNTYFYTVFADNRSMLASYYTVNICGDSYAQRNLEEFVIDYYTGNFSGNEGLSLIAYGEDENVIDTVE